MPILTEQERIGTLLAGKYRVRAILARGGMGVLFVGEHSWTARSVAIKLLHPQHTTDSAIAARFLREGRAATALRHPHVVDVLDMGQAEDGALFMVFELLEGADLGRVHAERGALDAASAIEILSPIVDALAVAHERGFVHRDLKPSNVFLARHGPGRFVAKLLDFGIAKAMAEGERGATSTGMIVGTPHYMSPEQASGTRDIGPPTDVWATGVVLYELIAGALPYDGGSPTAILMAILNTAHPPLCSVAPGTPPRIAALIESALERDPSLRPSDLRAWLAELRTAAGLSALSMPLLAPRPTESTILDDTLLAAPGAVPVLSPIAEDTVVSGVRPRPLRWIAVAAAIVTLLALGVAIASSALSPSVVATSLAPDAGAEPTRAEHVASSPPTPVEPAELAPSVVPATPAETPAPERATKRTERTSSPAARRRQPRRDGEHEPASGRRPIAEITTEW